MSPQGCMLYDILTVQYHPPCGQEVLGRGSKMPAVAPLSCVTSPLAGLDQYVISTVVASMQDPRRSSPHLPVAARSPRGLTGLRSSIHVPVAAHRPDEPTQAQDPNAGRIQVLEHLLHEKQAALDDLQRRSASQQGVFAEQKVRSLPAAIWHTH